MDGNERWRPVQLEAVVQARPLLVPLVDRAGNYMFTADQAGKAYLINSATGQVVWVGNGNIPIGTRIQAQAVTQLYDYADAAFQAANGSPRRDLAFFGTRNSSTTNNRVVALSSVNGSIVWSYQPGDQISYYVSGEGKRVKVNEAAKLAAEWTEAAPDESTAYYVAKLQELYEKFRPLIDQDGLAPVVEDEPAPAPVQLSLYDD